MTSLLREWYRGMTMTIQIPDDLARELEGMAAAQKKSAAQVALESLRLLCDHPAAVDDLENRRYVRFLTC